MTSGTRRLVTALILVGFAASLGLALAYGPQGTGFSLLYQLRWPLITLVAIIVAAIWQRSQQPPKPKPRPTHIKIVKSDETRH